MVYSYVIHAKTNLRHRLQRKFGGMFIHFGPNLSDILKEYIQWVKDENLSQSLIWHADVYDVSTQEYRGYLQILEDGSVQFTRAYNKKKQMNRYSIRQLIAYFL